MLDRIIHVNSKGEVLDFLELGIYVNYNDLRDYEWTVTTSNNRITRFTKGVVKKTIPFVFWVRNNLEAKRIKDGFYTHFEVDVESKTKGYFQIGEYKMYCYMTKITNSNYLLDSNYLRMNCEYTTDSPEWVSTEHYSFYRNAETDYDFLDYDYDYLYDYSSKRSGSQSVFIEHFKPCDFKLTIYGACVWPRIIFNGHPYQVFVSLDRTEFLTIDSKTHKIEKHMNNGKVQNCFDLRNKESTVFEKIPNGSVTAVWDASFGFDLDLYLERGQPEWNL